MKSRLVFWKSCLVLAVIGILGTSAVFAQNTVRWKTPRVETPSLSAQVVGEPLGRQIARNGAQNGTNPVFVTVHSPVKQVRFAQQGEPSIAEIDTVFPESRPEIGRDQSITTPPDPPSQGGLFGTNPALEEEYGGYAGGLLTEEGRRRDLEIICPDTGILKPIRDIDHDIRLTTVANIPKECPIMVDESSPIRDWNRICFMWKASGLCHKPLYFEEKALEVYGHTFVREEFQPIASSLHFFLSIPVLPYKMGINPPNECLYSLGDYRPGDCAPYMLDPLPLSVRAGLIQAGAIAGGIAIFP